MAGGKPQESRVVYFPTHPDIISDMRKLKKITVVSGIDRRLLIFAWSRPSADFPDTYLSTISDDRGNHKIPDLPDI